ncbi:MAG: LEPR-XLL domain-containing protein, partial [Planctomycetota bacterium]
MVSPPHRPVELQSFEPRLLMAGDVLYAVNAGGPSLTDAQGTLWAADAPGFYNLDAQSDTFNLGAGTPLDTDDPDLPPGTDQRLFRTERWDAVG